VSGNGDIVPEQTSILAVIERAALNPDIDVTKMQQLLEMHERIVAKQAEAAYTAGMNRVQMKMGRVSADAMNPQTRSKYASYANLDRELRPIYGSDGFSLSFGTADSPLPDHVRVICDVSHSAGHTRQHHIDMPADGKGAKGGEVMTKTHARGAAVTYGMRYLLKMIFNVAIGEDDYDGNTAEVITEDQAMDIEALITEVGANREMFLRYVGAKTIQEIPAASFSRAINALQQKRKQHAK